MVRWLMKLLEPFRVFKHRRERLAERERIAREERHAERAHQAKLLETFLTSLQSIQETSSTESAKNSEGLIAVANSMAKQAEGFAKWIELFQVKDAPTSSVIREEDEVAAELEKAGLPRELANVPEEFRLAYVLHNDPNLKPAGDANPTAKWDLGKLSG